MSVSELELIALSRTTSLGVEPILVAGQEQVEGKIADMQAVEEQLASEGKSIEGIAQARIALEDRLLDEHRNVEAKVPVGREAMVSVEQAKRKEGTYLTTGTPPQETDFDEKTSAFKSRQLAKQFKALILGVRTRI
jgi:hypothetical protein